MSDDLWESIQRAYDFIKSGASKRVDGEGWSVYRAGSIIRVDIKVEG